MKAYILSNDYSHLCDTEYDISFLPFENLSSLRNLTLGTEIVDWPRPIKILANPLVIPDNSDFPLSGISIPVLSKRMITVLNQVGSLNIRSYSTLLIKDTYPGSFKDAIADNWIIPEDYRIVQPLDKMTLMDYENSIYDAKPSWAKFPTMIHSLVLKEPDLGFPPLFRVEERPSSLFVSTAAKEALLKSDIKGCSFEEIGVTSTKNDHA